MVINITNLSREHIILLNKVSNEIKEEFNTLTKKIYNASNKSIDWLVNSTLSRNPYFSDIYINICYLSLIKKLLQEKKYIKSIIVPNKAIKKVLDDYFLENHLSSNIIFNQQISFKKHFLRMIKPVYRLLHIILKFLLLRSIKNKSRMKNISFNQEITLIDTFFLPSMFKNGKFKDRYYNEILSYLSLEEKKNIYFVPLFLLEKGLKKAVEIAKNANENFIYKEDFLKISDYVFALLSPFRIKKIDFSPFTFKGFRISPILKSDFKSNILNLISLYGILNYRFIKRLKENNIKIRLFVDWFENQVIDRGFNKGIKDFYPSTPCIGYQGYIISTDYNFYIQPTIYEQEGGIIPDEIAVVGKGLVKKIKEFNNKLKVKIAPAFRFQDVWEPIDYIKMENKKVVLIALPIVLKESIEIIQLILELLHYRKSRNLKFLIKPHPYLSISKVKNIFNNNLPESLEFIDGDFKECVTQADIMIGNTSTTCLEALAMGIPVIIIGSQSGLTQNPIPDSITKDIWKLCYTLEELSKAVNNFLKMSDEDKLKLKTIGKKIKREYFEPVTEEGVRNFLKLNPE